MRLGPFPLGAGRRGGRLPLPTALEDACEEAAGSGAGSHPTVQPLPPTPIALEDDITGLRADTPPPAPQGCGGARRVMTGWPQGSQSTTSSLCAFV